MRALISCPYRNRSKNLVEVNHGHDGTGNQGQRRGHASSTALGDTGDTSLTASTASLGRSGDGGDSSVLGGSVGGDDGLSNGGGLLEGGSGLGDAGKSGSLLGGNSGGNNSRLGGGSRLGDRGSGVRTLVLELRAVVDLTGLVGDLEVVGVGGELRRSEGERVTISRSCCMSVW